MIRLRLEQVQKLAYSAVFCFLYIFYGSFLSCFCYSYCSSSACRKAHSLSGLPVFCFQHSSLQNQKTADHFSLAAYSGQPCRFLVFWRIVRGHLKILPHALCVPHLQPVLRTVCLRMDGVCRFCDSGSGLQTDFLILLQAVSESRTDFLRCHLLLSSGHSGRYHPSLAAGFA